MIQLKNVTKTIENEFILSDINLNLESGKIYGFIGRNGSGKSMLFKTICGFIRPDKGEVIVNNKNLYSSDSFPTETAALIEKPNFIPDLTGFENLKLLASIKNIITDERIFQVLKDVNLYEERNKKFKKYSLGMRQKLGIAQVLMENPKIMIFDEPFNGLDEESTEKIRNILLKEKRNNKLILIATHIKEDIEILCDELYRLDAGKIIEKSKK